jgi:7-keto-8-aminopelargonate synthetase-like enzyme
MQKINWMKLKIQDSRSHQSQAFDEINGLIIQERKGKQIILDDNKSLIEFVSCSYLGLDQDQRVIDSVSQGIQKFGFSFHAARTRVQPQANLELEEILKEVYCGAYALTFPSLHMTHQGIFPLLASGEMPSFPLASNGCTFIIDKTAHASIQINRGLLEQFGEIILVDFQQLDQLTDLARSISDQKQTPILIADSVGSMGGVVPINELIALVEKFNGYIYLDDAHGTSVHGKNGSGYVLKTLNYQFHPRLIISATLGKAFGAMGGVLLLPTAEDIRFTKQFSPTYIFAGPVALPVVNAAIASAKIHLTDEIYQLQDTLWKNVDYFDSLISGHIVNLNSPSPIRGIFIGDEFNAIKVAKELREHGFAVTTAMYPTVHRQKSILRVALSALHQKNDILNFCNSLKEVFASDIFINNQKIAV